MLPHRILTPFIALAAAIVGLAATAPAPATQAATQSACVTSVAIDELVATADGCLTREGLVWRTSGQVDFGGLTMVPGPGARFTVDPFNARVSARGYEAQASGAQAGLGIGLITLINRGNFDITFQKLPRANASAAFIGTTTGRKIDLADIAVLPGLDGVRDLPAVTGPDGTAIPELPDFSRVSARDVEALHMSGTIRGGVTGDTVTVPLSVLGLPRLEPLIYTLPPQAGQFLGLGLDGKAELIPGRSGGKYGLKVLLSAELKGTFLDGLDGEVGFFIAPGGVFRVDSLRFEAGQLAFGNWLLLKPVELSYDRNEGTWGGKTTVYIPMLSKDRGLGADWRVRNGKIERIGISVPVRVPLGAAFMVNRLGGAVEVAPSFKLAAVGSVGTALEYGGNSVISLDDATLEYSAGDPADADDPRRVSLGGNWMLAGDQFGTSYLEITGSRASMAVAVDATLKSYVKLVGRVEGFIAWSPRAAIQVEGDADLRFGGDVRVQAKAIVSAMKEGSGVTGGIAACGRMRALGFDVGVGGGYLWREKKWKVLDATCDFGPFRVNPEATPPAPQGTSGVYLEPDALSPTRRTGSRSCYDEPATPAWEAISVRLKGYSRAPEVTGIEGMNRVPLAAEQFSRNWSRTYAVAPDASKQVIQGDGYVVMKDVAAKETTVIIGHPRVNARGGERGGTQGSLVCRPYFLVRTSSGDRFQDNPEVTVSLGDPLASGSLKAGRLSVSTDVPVAPSPGGKRSNGVTDGDDADPAPNPTVTLIERGEGVARVIRTYREDDALRGLRNARARDLSMRFRPARGPAGMREIVASISMYGLPREEKVIARFRAKASTLARPRVRVIRTGPTTAVVRWQRVPGATGYLVSAGFNDDTVAYAFDAGTTALRLDDVVPESGISAVVRATSTYPAMGPAGSATARRFVPAG